MPQSPQLDLLFLNRREIAGLTPAMPQIMDIIETGLRAHGAGEVVLPPKGHIHLDDRYNGHFNILMGYAGPIDTAGVKVIGDYVDNYRHGLPSEIALLTLYEPRTGIPLCIMDATDLTWLRTGAVTGIGARRLAAPKAKILAHIGARGTAAANIRAIAGSFDLSEVRIASKRPETRDALAHEIEAELGIKTLSVAHIEDAVADADIIVEATRLETPQILIADHMVKPGALLITYGWIMAVDPALPLAADKMIVDDWRQCCEGGTFHSLIKDGRLRREHVHAEIGQVVSGARPARENDHERIVFWHRGFAISDIVLGRHLYDRALQKGAGRKVSLW
ncbi:ornithine cyclodeaminase family protein [Taklimakanibacter lacteus]|uniref:ornithine cyclodeaminase family protein n=1 Tax=Taklimakanibacter lacteus TaxID=2268456 RepID=UPI000E66E7B2